jgi:hypothetical protein
MLFLDFFAMVSFRSNVRPFPYPLKRIQNLKKWKYLLIKGEKHPAIQPGSVYMGLYSNKKKELFDQINDPDT